MFADLNPGSHEFYKPDVDTGSRNEKIESHTNKKSCTHVYLSFMDYEGRRRTNQVQSYAIFNVVYMFTESVDTSQVGMTGGDGESIQPEVSFY